MPARPPFYRQVHIFSCAPACLRMVLHSFGHGNVPEAHLREICECDETGTAPEKVAEAAIKHFNLTKSVISHLTLDGLREELSRGLWPIVYLDLLDKGLRNLHAVVVVEVGDEQVLVLDPDLDHPGERNLPIADFEHAWSSARRRTIIIE